MSRPVPKNLQLLYDSIGPKAAARMHEGHSFEIDGVEFVTGYVPESTADRFYIGMAPKLAWRWEDGVLLARHEVTFGDWKTYQTTDAAHRSLP